MVVMNQTSESQSPYSGKPFDQGGRMFSTEVDVR